jgi:integrase
MSGTARSQHEHVFTTRDGRPLRSIRTAFDTACRHAKLTGVTPHGLRHTLASRLMMAGGNLRTVMELGGWKNLAMVRQYSHLRQKCQMEAVELLARNSPSVFTTVQEVRNSRSFAPIAQPG